MNDRDDLERKLRAWLEETAEPMPPDLFHDIVATARRVPRAGVRATFPSGGRWGVAIAGLAAVVVVAVALAAAFRVPLAPGASSSPGAPSLALSPTSSSVSPSVAPTAPSPTAPTNQSEAPSLGEWHRNNYNAGAERLICREETSLWTCSYLLPDGSGLFTGQNATDSWTCPAWFPEAICEEVTSVYGGSLTLTTPFGQTPGPGSTVIQDYVITAVGGQAILQLYWVDQFVCPWYRTLDEALAAPFECTFAPGVTPPGGSPGT